jgi:hypothetical protein
LTEGQLYDSRVVAYSASGVIASTIVTVAAIDVDFSVRNITIVKLSLTDLHVVWQPPVSNSNVLLDYAASLHLTSTDAYPNVNTQLKLNGWELRHTDLLVPAFKLSCPTGSTVFDSCLLPATTYTFTVVAHRLDGYGASVGWL